MLGEPQQTEYDLKFDLFGTPVRVHPFFWVLAILLGIRGSSGAELIIWVAVVFVSVLVHEYGHAWVIRYYGWTPRIVLHSFGGLAIYDPSFAPWQDGKRPRQTPAKQILISLAGPGAGFLFAFVVIFVLYATQQTAAFFDPATGRNEAYFRLFGGLVNLPTGTGENPISNMNLLTLVWHLLSVNIYWGILNLMPIFPLDGGQVARQLFLTNSNDGLRKSLQLSIATGIVLAVLCLTQFRSTYMAFMFGYLAFMNYQQLNGPFGGSRRW